jgi:RHS repeat-associated protein
MVRVRNWSNDALVAEYTSNGLGFRTSWKYDAKASGTVDGSDPVYWFTHDEKWRIVATYRGSDTDPREVFVWHSAGMDGGGGSSYIDSVVLRQDDTTTAWTAAPDTLNRRVYPLQNWRADVVAVYDLNEGIIAERVRYSAYGVPFCVSAADFDGDGDVDAADNTAYSNANTAGDPSADLNLDNVVDFNDTLAWNNLYNAGETGGRSVLSRSSVRNRIGYAGYQHDPSITGSAQGSGQGKYHVRFRVYDAGVGRWTRRDPLGYVDGMSVYEYVGNFPLSHIDATGLVRCASGSDCGIKVYQDPGLAGHRWIEYGPGAGGSGFYPPGVWYVPGMPPGPHPNILPRPGGDPATGRRPADELSVERANCERRIITPWFPGGPGGMPPSQEVEKEIEFGPGSGTPCPNATCDDIRKCLQNFVPPLPYDELWYNCRHAVRNALSSCCLSGG